MKAFSVMLLVPLFTVTYAQTVQSWSSSAPTAPISSLSEARIFALSPVGFAGKTSQEEIRFKAIFRLDRDKAKEELERLYLSGNPQAMSYALVGMRKLDRNRYAELLTAARASQVTVTTMWGCRVENEKLATVANDLDAGQYDSWLRWMEKPSF